MAIECVVIAIDLVNTMYRNKRLTESAIIRSLCAGNVRFFEAAMAKRASISLQNARMLLMDAGIRGFEALYDAAQMPESFRLAVRALFKAAQQETGYGKYYHQHFSQRMLERLTEDGQSQHIENMDTLMAMIDQSRCHHRVWCHDGAPIATTVCAKFQRSLHPPSGC